jgi:hypothetical protein
VQTPPQQDRLGAVCISARNTGRPTVRKIHKGRNKLHVRPHQVDLRTIDHWTPPRPRTQQSTAPNPPNTQTNDQEMRELLRTLLPTRLQCHVLDTEEHEASLAATAKRITTLTEQVEEMKTAIARAPQTAQPQTQKKQGTRRQSERVRRSH